MAGFDEPKGAQAFCPGIMKQVEPVIEGADIQYRFFLPIRGEEPARKVGDGAGVNTRLSVNIKVVVSGVRTDTANQRL
jgi:hypothetical protein